MSSFDIISMAIKNLLKRKLRTTLTLSGVIIGTISVVMMVSLGLAVRLSSDEMLNNIGDITLIEVYMWGETTANQDQKRFADKRGNLILNDNAIEAFNEIDGVLIATALDSTHFKAVSGKYHNSFSVIGIDPEVFKLFGYEIEVGRGIEDGDKMDMVFGSRIAASFEEPSSNNRMYRYYDYSETPEDVINLFEDRIRISTDFSFGDRRRPGEPARKIDSYRVETIGVLKPMDYQTDFSAFMHKDQLKKIRDDERRQKEKETGVREDVREGYDRVLVKCENIDVVLDVQEQIRALGFTEAYSNMEWIQTSQEYTQVLQIVLGALGSISLFVAAIGITNTMVMAIYERTREIGVMKVIGASVKDIRRLFLIEASLIGFIGGAFGVILSLIISNTLNKYAGSFVDGLDGTIISHIPLWLSPIAMGFTSMVGLVSGYFPARRATKLSALSAIKTE